jgi:hypothetical protein
MAPVSQIACVMEIDRLSLRRWCNWRRKCDSRGRWAVPGARGPGIAGAGFTVTFMRIVRILTRCLGAG